MEKANARAKVLYNTIEKYDPFQEEDALTSAKAKRLSKFRNKSPYNKLFTKKELDNVVANFPNRAPGPDMIFPQSVKALPKKWMNVLLEVINLAWDSGVFLSP